MDWISNCRNPLLSYVIEHGQYFGGKGLFSKTKVCGPVSDVRAGFMVAVSKTVLASCWSPNSVVWKQLLEVFFSGFNWFCKQFW